MKILSFETSCDETAVAVIENGTNEFAYANDSNNMGRSGLRVLHSAIFSQIDIHKEIGGVVPEVAAREHIIKIIPVLDEALTKSGVSLQEIDAIAVSNKPGLISSLLTGTVTASTLALALGKPIIPVNHIHGHIYANWLDRDADEIQFPIVVLTVSGGHNELVLMKEHCSFEVLGETLDDAAGEAFDKVARLIGLGYPGGPAISKAAVNGDKYKFDLPRAWLKKGSLDFSFSGLKSAVARVVAVHKIDTKFQADMSASFQEAVCEVLSEKLLIAARKYNAKEIHLAGGVSANKRLREVVAEKAVSSFVMRYPANIHYCTDNGAMIGAAGYFMFVKNPAVYTDWKNVEASAGIS
ncbi:MAG: tRNA (adenosine(37)-N6)-threonylcarbamoyltransferase complex transferase subunit TsaD [Candidatus Gracilibacteria bacterium]